MILKLMALMRRLGFKRFIQLLAHAPSFFRLFARLVKDPRVSLPPKLVVAGILLYALFPVDLLPDFFFGLGQLDDLLVIFLGLGLFLRLCPQAIVREHVQAIATGH